MLRINLLLLTLLAVANGPRMLTADVVVNINEFNGGVIANATGQLNIDALAFVDGALTGNGEIRSSDARLFIGGNGNGFFDRYIVDGPASFGNANFIRATGTVSGDPLGIWGGNSEGTSLYLGQGFTSGDEIESSAFFDAVSFADLGLTEGTYVYSWGTGATADSITVNIQATAVPEPSAMVALGFTLLVGACSRRRRLQNY